MSGVTVFKRLDTDKERETRLVKFHIRKLMFDVSNDPFMLCELVAAGGSEWRRQAHQAFSPYPLTDDIADRMFLFFCAAVQAKFGAHAHLNGTTKEGFQSEHLDAALIAGDFLDSCEPVAPRPSKDEIAKGWRIDDASSDSAKRAEYEATGMHPQEALDKLIAFDQDTEQKH
jgi:hypothetical protein